MLWTAPRRVECLPLVQCPLARRVGRHRLSSVIGPRMTAIAKSGRIPAILFGCVGGLLMLAAPWVFLFTSSKSPLASHDSSDIGAFTMGAMFMFFQGVGGTYLYLGIAAFRRKPSAVRPAQ